MSVSTKPDVFIIESLGFDDEAAKLPEGRLISEMLAMSGKECKYFYVRTKRELVAVLKLFSESKYRYLHLSCHGSKSQQKLHTTLDAIPFVELGPILRPHLRNRRLFLSAYSMSNQFLARQLMPKSGCYSVLGPRNEILFRTAPILWASLYHVMFSADDATMKHAVLRVKAQEVANMFRVQLNFIRRKNEASEGYVIQRIIPAKEPGKVKKKRK
jgi:hypothetical protein